MSVGAAPDIERNSRRWQPQPRAIGAKPEARASNISNEQLLASSGRYRSSISEEPVSLSMRPGTENRRHISIHNPTTQSIISDPHLLRGAGISRMSPTAHDARARHSESHIFGAGTRDDQPRPMAMTNNDIVFSADRRRSAPILSPEFIALARSLSGPGVSTTVHQHPSVRPSRRPSTLTPPPPLAEPLNKALEIAGMEQVRSSRYPESLYAERRS
jgi:hypothetical protein